MSFTETIRDWVKLPLHVNHFRPADPKDPRRPALVLIIITLFLRFLPDEFMFSDTSWSRRKWTAITWQWQRRRRPGHRTRRDKAGGGGGGGRVAGEEGRCSGSDALVQREKQKITSKQINGPIRRTSTGLLNCYFGYYQPLSHCTWPSTPTDDTWATSHAAPTNQRAGGRVH